MYFWLLARLHTDSSVSSNQSAAANQIKQEQVTEQQILTEPSTSGQGQTIVTVTPASGQLDHTQTVVTSQPQQVVMSENADGTTSLSIAHVQTLSGQTTLQLANLNQVISQSHQ